MWLEYSLVNDFMREWCPRKEQLKNGEISVDEYLSGKSTDLIRAVVLMKKAMI